MGAETLLAGGLILSAIGTGVSTINAIDQNKRAKATRKAQKAAQEEADTAALNERKQQIDQLRDSALGMTAGRRTLLSGSETGRTSLLSNTLG
jgi:uncharacterized protein HemX